MPMNVYENGTCPGPSCDKPSRTLKQPLCEGHYKQMMKGAELTEIFRTSVCTVCSEPISDERGPGSLYCIDCRDTTRKDYMKELGRKRTEAAFAPGKRRNGLIDPELKLPLGDGVCEICGDFGPLCRDHDNNCCVAAKAKNRCGDCERGSLCLKCNSMLGMAKDSVMVLSQAIKYLMNWSGDDLFINDLLDERMVA